MNRYVKRGISAYKIFLKNKFVASIMMLMSGIMMFIAAIQGKGNDLYSLPILITTLGTVLTLWSVYRLGVLKSNYDYLKKESPEIKKLKQKELILQILEILVYMIVAGLGVFLLSNQEFTNKILNLMAGFFTTLNGVLNIFTLYKNRKAKDFQWKFRAILMVFELILGPFFLINSDSIDISGYIIMGILTTLAGIVEVITASTRENLRSTINDGKDIAKIIKTGKKSDVSQDEEPTSIPK